MKVMKAENERSQNSQRLGILATLTVSLREDSLP